MVQESKTPPTTNTGLAYGITSLSTGILAFLTGWIFFLSVPLGAVAIVFGALGLRKPGSKGLAIAGLVSGIVGFSFGFGLLVITVATSLTASAPEVPVIQTSPQMFYRY